MKRILLRSLPDPRFPLGSEQYEPNRVDYRALIEQCIRVPLDRQQGATIDEMRKGIRVLDALDRTPPEGVMQLEDADWEHLRQKVQKMPWAVIDRRFIQFHDEVMEASEAVAEPQHSDGLP
jgi:hypothetical protein